MDERRYEGSGEDFDDTQPRGRQGIEVALLLTGAAVFVALIAGRASFLSASAASLGQSAVRQEVKQAAGYVESIRYIWGVEVPRAVTLFEARFRAEELNEVLGGKGGEELKDVIEGEGFAGPARDALLEERAVQTQLVQTLSPASDLGSDPRYRTEVGFDPVAMLIDDRATYPEVLAADPDHAEERAHEQGEKAIRLVGVTVLLALAFFCGCLARGFPHTRGLWLSCGGALMALGFLSAVFVEVA